MPRFNEVINNFINGEVSPKVYGRMDSEIYKRSCRTLKNMIAHPQGGVSRRPSTEFVSDVFPLLDSAADNVFETINDGARVVPFVFDDDEKYLIVFNQTQDSSGVNDIKYYFVDEDMVSAATFVDNVIVNYNGNYTGRSTENFKTVETDDNLQNDTVIAEMQYAQAGAVMIFTHELIPPFCVIRRSRGRLDFVPYSYQFTSSSSTDFGPWPFMELNLSDIKIHASAGTVGTGITLTSTADFFDSGHVGSPICFLETGTAASVGMAIVTAVASGTVATAEITRALGASATTGTAGTGGTVNWYESAWSDYRGYPRSVTYLNGALYFGGSPTFPDRIWKSQDFDIFEMSNPDTQNPGVDNTPDDPFFADLAVGRGISYIQGLAASGNDLIALTRSREYAISAFNSGEISVKPQTGYGAEYRQPMFIDDTPVYVQRGFRKIREIIFDDRTQGYISPEVTYLADHMPRLGITEISGATLQPKIKQLEYQQLDNSILWAIDNNGFLFGCTKYRLGNVAAFHRHDVGGTVISIAALPNKDGTSDDLYMIVSRTVNSATKIYLEKIPNEFQEESLNVDTDDSTRLPKFSDCCKVFRRNYGAANFFASLNTAADADTADGSVTATVTGTPVFANNRMILGKSGTDYVSYDGTSNADFAQVGTIRFWATLFYNGGRQTLFSISKAGGDADNLIELYYDNPGGAFSGSMDITLTINDSAGSAIINNVTLGSITTSSTAADSRADGLGYKIPMFFELCYDLTNGATRLFINGEQFGSTQTGTGTRDTSIDLIRIGADYSGSNPIAESAFWDFEIHDSVLHTADYEVYEYQPTGVSLRGLSYLEGKTVQVTADGNYVGDFTVSSGAIADIGADYSTNKSIVVGLPYTSTVEIQPLEIGSGIGAATGSIKRIDRFVGRFRASATAKAGPDTDNLEIIQFRDDTTPLTDPIALVTDDKVLDFDGDYDRQARVVISTDDPLPMNLTCISCRGITGDV